MSKQINFFMTQDDLYLLSKKCETFDLAFYDTNCVNSEHKKPYIFLNDVPHLGTNICGSYHVESYLVMFSGISINTEKVLQRDGKTHYLINQCNNPHSIVFYPSGMYRDKYLIMGELSTISKTVLSAKLFSLFSKLIKQICNNHKGSVWYSDDVKKPVNVRLITINTNEPSVYDLKI